MRIAKEYIPHTTYHYYLNMHSNTCKSCDNNSHHLLRYRTYLLSKYPVIPTRNTYFLVCDQCSDSNEVEDEFLLMQLLQKARQVKPVTFNNMSIKKLTFHDYLKSHITDMNTHKDMYSQR